MDDLLRSERCFTHPGLPLNVARVRVDADVVPHQHEFQEIVSVARGRATHVVELMGAGTRPLRAQRYALLPGDCFLVAPDERHAFREAKGLVVYNILFLPELIASERTRLETIAGLSDFLFVEPMFRHEAEGVPKMHLDVDERARVLSSLDAIVEELAQGADGFDVMARARFLTLLVQLARAWHRQRGKPSVAPASVGQRQALDAAIAFIEENYGEDISLKSIADRAYLSPHHFSEQFKRHCGLPPWEFLVRLRIDRAKELLRASDRSVTDIALTVGFGDSSYFARVFKVQAGLTPRQFRLHSRPPGG